jgi:hypothetical protein
MGEGGICLLVREFVNIHCVSVFYRSESFLNSLNIFVLHILTLYTKIYTDVRKVPENSDLNCTL